MYEPSFDGSRRALDLLSRIGAEERVGDSLSPDTISLYGRKMRHVAARMSGGKISELTPEMVVRDLNDRVDSMQITQATARVEKSAALFWIAEEAQSLMDSGSHDFGRYESAYRDILTMSTRSLPKKSKNTSAKKLKAFPDEAVDILMETARTEKSPSLLRALLFIRANLYVGLRPVEWFGANLIEYQHRNAFGEPKHRSDGTVETSPALEVTNAKHSSIRGNGDKRTILLDTLNERQIQHLQQWIQLVNELKSEELMLLPEAAINRKIYGSLQRAIRSVLSSAEWNGEMPTIYSTRHQAVANARADGQTQQEIAALFGHSSTNTARRHYGKKYAGYSGRSMRAAPESILAVRSTVTARLPDVTWHEPLPGAAQPERK